MSPFQFVFFKVILIHVQNQLNINLLGTPTLNPPFQSFPFYPIKSRCHPFNLYFFKVILIHVQNQLNFNLLGIPMLTPPPPPLPPTHTHTHTHTHFQSFPFYPIFLYFHTYVYLGNFPFFPSTTSGDNPFHSFITRRENARDSVTTHTFKFFSLYVRLLTAPTNFFFEP